MPAPATLCCRDLSCFPSADAQASARNKSTSGSPNEGKSLTSEVILKRTSQKFMVNSNRMKEKVKQLFQERYGDVPVPTVQI